MYSWSGQSDNPKSENPIEKTDHSGPRLFSFFKYYRLRADSALFFIFIGAERIADFCFCKIHRGGAELGFLLLLNFWSGAEIGF